MSSNRHHQKRVPVHRSFEPPTRGSKGPTQQEVKNNGKHNSTHRPRQQHPAIRHRNQGIPTRHQKRAQRQKQERMPMVRKHKHRPVRRRRVQPRSATANLHKLLLHFLRTSRQPPRHQPPPRVAKPQRVNPQGPVPRNSHRRQQSLFALRARQPNREPGPILARPGHTSPECNTWLSFNRMASPPTDFLHRGHGNRDSL